MPLSTIQLARKLLQLQLEWKPSLIIGHHLLYSYSVWWSPNSVKAAYCTASFIMQLQLASLRLVILATLVVILMKSSSSSYHSQLLKQQTLCLNLFNHHFRFKINFQKWSFHWICCRAPCSHDSGLLLYIYDLHNSLTSHLLNSPQKLLQDKQQRHYCQTTSDSLVNTSPLIYKRLITMHTIKRI